MVCAHSLIFLLSTASHHLHTHRGSSVCVLSCHLHSHGHLSVSPRLDSPFLFPALPHVPYLLPPVLEVRGKPAHSAKREYGLHRRVLPLHRTRTGEDVVPGHALFQWMLRHTRFQPQSHRGGTPWEIRTGTCYKSPLLPFLEACMIRVPVDPPGLRRKLDVQWMKGTWVWTTR